MALLALMVMALLPLPALLQRRTQAREAKDRLTALRSELAGEFASTGEPAPGGTSPQAPIMPVLRGDRAALVLTTATQQYALRAEVEPVMARWPQPSCLSVRHNNRQLLNVNADQPLIPASLQKLFTAAAVLEYLDANERLTTRVVSEAVPIDGVLEGDIWVIGGGDPLIATTSYIDGFTRQPQLRTEIEALADALVALPITVMRGRLLGDESRHDTTRYVESWPDRYRARFSTGPLSALTVDDGLAAFQASVGTLPDPALEFVKLLHDLLLVRGVVMEVTLGTGTAARVANLDSDDLDSDDLDTGNLDTDDLDTTGNLDTTGSLDTARDPTELARLESPTVREMVRQMLRESDNNTAEILLREVGLRSSGVGSTTAGAAAVAQVVGELTEGLQPPTVIDGSGLDRGNAATCAHLTEVLDYFGPDSIVGTGLPVAAESGTLKHRFRAHAAAGVLKAKTGLLTGVNALAGFLETATGVLTFAQITNGVPRDSTTGSELLEELVGILLRHPIDCSAALAYLTAPWGEPGTGDGGIASGGGDGGIATTCGVVGSRS